MAATLSPAPVTTDAAADDRKDAKEERGSLRPVLAVIPDECYENPTWKGLAYFARDLALYAFAIWGLFTFANPLIVLPFLVLFVPIADGVVVVITRLWRGVHPFTAGHDHLAHRLISQGMSRRVAVAALWLVAGTAALAAQVIAGTSFVAVAACFAPVALVLGRCLWRPG